MSKTDQKTQDEKKPDPRTVEQIDFTKPFAVLIHQTPSRNNFEIVTQADCKDDETPLQKAAKIAAAMALNHGRTVAVFGPQAMVKIPPKEPQADDLDLNF